MHFDSRAPRWRMKLSAYLGITGLGMMAVRGAVACSGSPAANASASNPAPAPSEPATNEPDGGARPTPHSDAGSRADAGMKCVLGEACTGDARCSVNEGGTF